MPSEGEDQGKKFMDMFSGCEDGYTEFECRDHGVCPGVFVLHPRGHYIEYCSVCIHDKFLELGIQCRDVSAEIRKRQVGV